MGHNIISYKMHCILHCILHCISRGTLVSFIKPKLGLESGP